MRGFLFGLLVAVTVPCSVTGQTRPPTEYQSMAATRIASRIYVEAFALPAGRDKALVTVSFRIPNDRLVFMRHVDGVDDKLFRASVSATVELYQNGRVVKEEVWRSESFAAEYDDTVDPKKSTSGSVALLLDSGQYSVGVRLNDLNTERTASTPLRPVVAPSYQGTYVGRAVLADTVVANGSVRYVSTINLGGDALFGHDFEAVIPVAVDADSNVEQLALAWSLRRLDYDAVREEAKEMRRKMESFRRQEREDDERPVLEPPKNLEGGTVVASGELSLAKAMPVGSFVPADIHGDRITLPPPSDSTRFYLGIIDVEGAELENGAYVLDVHLKGEAESQRSETRFSTHWPDMPVSLLDVDVAIKNMRFIVDRTVIDELKRGSREDKIKKFSAFWSERDPTPGTAYNELMVEYFRRVDYAAMEYRTGPGMIPNGLETDRARIYIVHGPPDEVSRTFPEGGGVLETWVYHDGKSFTFESASSVDAFNIIREG